MRPLSAGPLGGPHQQRPFLHSYPRVTPVLQNGGGGGKRPEYTRLGAGTDWLVCDIIGRVKTDYSIQHLAGKRGSYGKAIC
jgi:hypothetical protein